MSRSKGAYTEALEGRKGLLNYLRQSAAGIFWRQSFLLSPGQASPRKTKMHSHRADGSGSWPPGARPTVQCVVHGPTEVRLRDERLGQATLDIIVRPASGPVGSLEMRALERHLHTVLAPAILLRQYPRSSLTVVLQFMDSSHSGPAGLVASINSAVLALLDAGVALDAMLVAGASADGSLVCSFHFPGAQLVHVRRAAKSTEPLPESALPALIAEAQEVALAAHADMRRIVGDTLALDDKFLSA